jgi:hypothetical protein
MRVFSHDKKFVYLHDAKFMEVYYNEESVLLVSNTDSKNQSNLSLKIDRWSGKEDGWKFVSEDAIRHEYRPVTSEKFKEQLFRSITNRSNLMTCSAFGDFRPYGGYGINKAISGLKVAKLMGCLNAWPKCIVQLAYDAACKSDCTMHWNIYRIFYKYSIRKIILGGEDNYANNVRWLKKATPDSGVIEYDSHDVTDYFMRIMTW